jgi:hypothetical protein
LVKGLMAGRDAGVSDLNTGGGDGCGGHAPSVSQKSHKRKYCDNGFEATSATA